MDVAVDAALGVEGELVDLPPPRPDLVADAAAAVAVVGRVLEEAVHALHLALDELHVAVHVAQQLRLLHQHRREAAEERVHGALGTAADHIHLATYDHLDLAATANELASNTQRLQTR